MMIAEDEPGAFPMMRRRGKISQKAFELAGEAVEPGVSTWEIDQDRPPVYRDPGGDPSFLGVRGGSRQRLYLCEQCGHPRHTLQKHPVKKGDIVGSDRYWSHVMGLPR